MKKILSASFLLLSICSFGQNSPAFFGAMFKELDILHESGVYISEVVPNSSADAAGLIKGDILFSLGEHEIHRYSDIVEAMTHFKTGDLTTVKFYRIMKPVEGSFRFYEKGKAPHGNPDKSFKKLYEDEFNKEQEAYDAKKKSLQMNNTNHTDSIPTFKGRTPVMTMLKSLPDEYRFVGLFIVQDGWYELIFYEGRTCYLMSVFEQDGTFGKREQIVGVGHNTWKFAEDTGETFRMTNEALYGYMFGDPACTWKRIF